MKTKITAFIIGGIVLFSINYYFTTLDFFKDARVKYDKSYSAFLNENVAGTTKNYDASSALFLQTFIGQILT